MNNHQSGMPLGNILVVDDTAENLRLLSTMLTQSGYTPRCVINGKMALRACNSNPPDFILLDIMIPEMNGYEVCQHLKLEAKTREIPVIFISAKDEVFDKVNAFAVGGVDYISKPFQFEEVLARIESHLSLRNLQKQLKEQNVLLQEEITSRLAVEKTLHEKNQILQQEISTRRAVEKALQEQTLIDDLLEYSRVGRSRKPFQLTDCNQAVEQALANLQVAIPQTKAVVTYSELPAVMGDISQLVQLFQNLVGNSIKYRHDAPPVVHITASKQEKDWL